MSKSNTIRDSFIKSVPVMAGYIVLGIGYGILMNKAGYGLLWTAALSLFVYAGSMQYVAVDLLSAQASVLNTIITTIAVNGRHLFYSISMINEYKETPKKMKWYMIFGLTDETYSLLCAGNKIPDGDDPDQYRLFVTLFDHSYWVLGSILGAVLGSVIPFSTEGIDFSMTALFLATFVSQWISTDNHISALTGLFCSIACLVIFGPSNFLIPSMICMTVILTVFRKNCDPAVTGKEDV